MKTFLKIVVIIIGILAIIPLALPKHCHIERSIDIACTPEAAYALVLDQSQQKLWSPWVQMDPNTRTSTTGTGLGSVYEFESEKTGKGSSTIVAAESPKLVKYHLVMIKPMPGQFEAQMQIEPTATGCHLTWSYDQDLSYPMRYVGPMMEKMVGGPYQQGVENLKALLEKKS